MTRYLETALMLVCTLLFLVVAHGLGATIPALGVAVASFVAGALFVVALTKEDHND